MIESLYSRTFGLHRRESWFPIAFSGRNEYNVLSHISMYRVAWLSGSPSILFTLVRSLPLCFFCLLTVCLSLSLFFYLSIYLCLYLYTFLSFSFSFSFFSIVKGFSEATRETEDALCMIAQKLSHVDPSRALRRSRLASTTIFSKWFPYISVIIAWKRAIDQNYFAKYKFPRKYSLKFNNFVSTNSKLTIFEFHCYLIPTIINIIIFARICLPHEYNFEENHAFQMLRTRCCPMRIARCGSCDASRSSWSTVKSVNHWPRMWPVA